MRRGLAVGIVPLLAVAPTVRGDHVDPVGLEHQIGQDLIPDVVRERALK